MIRVLVIDDELAYRESLRLLMPTQGFIVETAASAEIAGTVGQYVRPRRDRRRLDAAQVGRRHSSGHRFVPAFPETCVIVISSYPTATLETRLLKLPNVRFLPKPFTLSSLVSAIRSLLAKSA